MLKFILYKVNQNIKNLVLLIVLICFKSIFGQNVAKIYHISNVFLPALQKEKSLKVGISTSTTTFHPFNYTINSAYSPKQNFAVKLNYRNSINHNNPKVSDGTDYKLNEIEIGGGFYKFYVNKPYQNFTFFSDKKNARFEKLNAKRADLNKPTLKPKFRKTPGFILEANLSYSFASLNGNEDFFIPGGVVNYKTIELKVEKLNLDLAFNLLLKKRFDFAYNFRTSIVNFKHIEIFNTTDPIENSIALISANDPFILLEQNFKINYSFEKYSIFIKNNIMLSNRNRIYEVMVDGFATIGFTLNLKN